jgi:Tfp pilus assembly protein PilZ
MDPHRGRPKVGSLTNISCRGAFVETKDAYHAGQSIRLEFKVEEKRIRIFGSVAYQQEGGEKNELHRPPGIGVIFYESDRDANDSISEIIEQIWNRYTP